MAHFCRLPVDIPKGDMLRIKARELRDVGYLQISSHVENACSRDYERCRLVVGREKSPIAPLARLGLMLWVTPL